MKKLLFSWLCAVFFMGTPLCAASLDGTSSVVYEASSYAFDDGDFARGFVRLNNGFSVPAAGSVSLNLLAPVAGTINLNGTGGFALSGDLSLESNVRLASGGVINGQGRAIFLNGNVSVPANSVLEFSGSTIIDGRGNELILKDGAPGGQLLINGPAGTTLTLRNMTLRGLKKFSEGSFAISFGVAANQALILENVTLRLADDFFFLGGRLEIEDNVRIMGLFDQESQPELVRTSFLYFSDEDLIINRDSRLTIDASVEFDYAPLDKKNSHIVFRTPSSELFLNGCVVWFPGDTGLRLFKGRLLVDHRTTIASDGVLDGALPMQIGDRYFPATNMAIDLFPGAKLEIEDATLNYQNPA